MKKCFNCCEVLVKSTKSYVAGLNLNKTKPKEKFPLDWWETHTVQVILIPQQTSQGSQKNSVTWVDIPLNPSSVPICGSESVLAGGSIYCGGKGRVVTLNWNWETRDFTAAKPSVAFQLNKTLFNVFHKSDQTRPSLIIPSDAGNAAHVMSCQDS